MSTRAYLSIGEVLVLLRDEFPDITISKIRFLESQGLVDPERTPSGYRKFYDDDVARLRWVLRQQREHFLPLKVIKGRLEAGLVDADQPVAPAPPVGAGMPSPGPAAGAMAAPSATAAPSAAAPSATGTLTWTEANPSQQPEVVVPVAVDGGGAPVDGFPRSADLGNDGPVAAAAERRGRATRRSSASPGAAVPGGGGAALPGFELAGDPIVAPGRQSTGPDGGLRPGGLPGGGFLGAGMADVDAGAGEAFHRLAASGEPMASPQAAGGPRPRGASRPAHDAGRAPRQRPADRGPGRPGQAPRAGAAPGSAAGGGVGWTIDEVAAASGLTVAAAEELVAFGLLRGRTVAGATYFDDDELAVAQVAGAFAQFGVEARHLRLHKHAAEREVGFIEQVVLPLVKQRNPEAQERAAATAGELAELGQRLRAALVRRALRDLVG